MLRLLLVVVALGFVAQLPAADTHQVKLNGQTFTLPVGFTIELAAAPTVVPRPITADFDEKGRLYVADSSGSNENVNAQLKNPTHRILRLESTKGDGVFDKVTVFADKMMFPEGTMWLAGSLYVAAPPHIWKLTDTNDDGVADKRDIWFDGKTLTGCANDLHGPYRGPDGYIYWCKGAFAKQEYTLDLPPLSPLGRGAGGEGKRKFSTRAAHIFRAKPDGTGLEPVMTGGMDNPVDVVFLPNGERFFTTTFLQHPAGGKRDGIIHAVYGAVYGKDHDPVYEHPWTSPSLMPPMTHLGAAAPSGLHRYELGEFGFGLEFKDNLFACCFNMHKVTRHVLVQRGSTYETKDSDFVVSDSLDFHPTDVLEDADGSLLIVDTGGWYKLCCPTSQLVKPDIVGGIYRVRKTGGHTIEDPRGAKCKWETKDQLDFLLSDIRPIVRRQAREKLLALGEEGIHVLANVPFTSAYSDDAWLESVWALTRVEHPAARRATRHFLNSQAEERFLVTGCHVTGLRRDKESLDKLTGLLSHSLASVCRAAAEAIGRIGDPKAIPAIFEALADEDNGRVLDHSLTYALIEIGDAKETAKGLAHKSPRVRRAALAALAAMPESLDRKAVLAELTASDVTLKETAWWITGKHPEWGGDLVAVFRERLKTADKFTPAERDEWTDRLVKFAKNETIQQFLAEAVIAKPSRQLVLGVMARAGLKTMPTSWVKALGELVSPADLSALRAVLAVHRAVPADGSAFENSVPKSTFWSNPYVLDDVRLAWLAARPAGAKLTDTDQFALVVRNLHRDAAPALRTAAADVLGRAKLTTLQYARLAETLPVVAVTDLPKLLDLFTRTTDEKAGLELVLVLGNDAKLQSAVRTDQLRPVLAKYSERVRTAAEPVFAKLDESTKDQVAKLEALLKELPTGDVRRGQVVFHTTKAACITCHAMGYLGGKLGPDLTRIGGIRAERDLLEAIVFPNASFVRSYESVKVNTLDGRSFNGILKKDAPDEVIVATSATEEVRIARADVESLVPGTVSVMPSGLDQQLSKQELADLIAFLKASK